jgi:hypothetical protein
MHITQLNESQTNMAAIARWPVSCAVLVALVDYGLTDEDIGRYFDVPMSKVTALRLYFGIGIGRATRERTQPDH